MEPISEVMVMSPCALALNTKQRTANAGIASIVIASLVLIPFGSAQSQKKAAAEPAFEVASVHLVSPRDAGLTSISPEGALHFSARNVTLVFLIELAFDVDSYQIEQKPSWLEQQEYVVNAKPEGETGPSYKELMPLLQQLLKQRFHLAYHRELQKMHGYALVIAEGGPRLKASGKTETAHAYILRDGVQARDMSMPELATLLKLAFGGRPVVDRTGLTGNYDVDLKYAPVDDPNSSLPSVFTALREQLGLKVEKRDVPVNMFVLDHIDRIPTAN